MLATKLIGVPGRLVDVAAFDCKDVGRADDCRLERPEDERDKFEGSRPKVAGELCVWWGDKTPETFVLLPGGRLRPLADTAVSVVISLLRLWLVRSRLMAGMVNKWVCRLALLASSI